MKRGSESGVGEETRTASSLASLLARLQALARGPAFALQRQRALSIALRPYAEYETQFGLVPLPEEGDHRLVAGDQDLHLGGGSRQSAVFGGWTPVPPCW